MLRGSRAFSDKIHRPFLAQVVPPFTTRVSGGETWLCKQERLKTRVCKISLRLQCIRGHQPPGPYHNTIQYNTMQYIHTYIHPYIHTRARALLQNGLYQNVHRCVQQWKVMLQFVVLIFLRHLFDDPSFYSVIYVRFRSVHRFAKSDYQLPPGNNFGSHWKNFREILFLNIFRKAFQKIQVLLRNEKNNE